ncbi:hypothetical protein [Halarchaeum nitratireducens]|uniref:Fenitrothion hydrolase n=1 Tax=Halarchaeum nitratireducens TaxID=489913 RepID=A0A830GDS2_9EURY|nr:hypothetical protein [Halarchaeum nitratireducens]GGN21890.1 hypothetical protein GCM10009021_24100 [Halarchaeum nitratireducens]
MRGRALRRAVWAVVSLLVTAGTVSAHQIQASRFAAPIPLGYLYAGAGVTVLVTAAASARLVSDPTADERTHAVLGRRATRALVAGVQLLAVAGFAVVLYRGFVGRQIRAANVATLVTWVLAVHGLALVAALVGSPWRVLAPWNALYDWLCRLEGRAVALRERDVAWLGGWPALAGFLLLVGVLENLTVVPESPSKTAALLAAYTLWMLAGLLVVGPTWREHADPVGVFLALLGRVAPIAVHRRDSRLGATLRAPWAACARPVASLGRVAFVVATVYTISFDGFTSTPQFQALLVGAHGLLGISYTATEIALYLAGFTGFLAAFALTAVLVDRLGGGHDVVATARRIAPSVLPIVVVYEVAHYSTAVVTSAARVAELALAGIGLDVAFAPLAWLSVPTYWGFEVVIIVVGHVVAVVAAHYATLRRYDDRTRAWRAHGPLVALMVAYTVLSLWIVSRPVVS